MSNRASPSSRSLSRRSKQSSRPHRPRGDAMNSHTMSADALYSGGDAAKSVRGWVLFAGITMLLVGATAILYDVTATVASVIAFGWLLMLAGAMQIVHAFQVRSWSGFF